MTWRQCIWRAGNHKKICNLIYSERHPIIPAFREYFRYPFDRECPNDYFAKIYAEDPCYILVIDPGNLSAAAIVDEFPFPPGAATSHFRMNGQTDDLPHINGATAFISRPVNFTFHFSLRTDSCVTCLHFARVVSKSSSIFEIQSVRYI